MPLAYGAPQGGTRALRGSAATLIAHDNFPIMCPGTSQQQLNPVGDLGTGSLACIRLALGRVATPKGTCRD
eukprot:1704866-Prymnesium_polylepis.2